MSKRLPNFNDINEMERLTGGAYLEDRDLLAYASNKTGGVILKNLKTGEEKKVTAGGRGEGNPQFSPDGSTMLFLSMKDGGRQIFLYNLETGSVTQRTALPTMVMDPIWSPDGKKILFTAPLSGGKKDSVPKRKDEPVVIEDFGYKFEGLGFVRPDEHMHLYVAAAEGGEPVCLTEDDRDYLHANWAPDSRTIVCVSDRFRSREDSLGYDLLKVDSETGEVTQLTKDLWLVSYPNPIRPACTPDGKSVIAGVMAEGQLSTEEESTYPEIYLYRVALDGSGAERVFEKDENCYQCVQFPYNAGCGWGFDKLQLSEDGRWAYFLSGWQRQGNIYRLDLEGDGHAETVASGKQVYNGLGPISHDKMIVAMATPVLPEAWYLMQASTGEILGKVLQSAQDLVDGAEWSEPEDFSFRTLDGEDRVHGWVLPPLNRKPGKKYPAILYIHGGPHPFYTYGPVPEFQAYAAEGFAVLYCNPRGSSGYGWAHQDLEAAMDGRAFTDLLQFVDKAGRRFDWIDMDRLGATGGSYGGYMVNYMASHCSRFKAYVTQRSMTNELIQYASSDMHGVSKKYENFEEFMVNALKASTVSYAERIDRPFLILHGMDDYRTPVEGAHQLYVAIKDLHPDLPCRMVLFPHTGHEQPSDPKLAKRYYDEMLQWFKRYLQ